MAPPTTRARANWAVQRATALPEFWALVAEHCTVVGAWRLMSVCKASRAGGKEFLSKPNTRPGLVVCGGARLSSPNEYTRVRDVWRLDLTTLRWEPMPALVTARNSHACCAVRGTLVVLGGATLVGGTSSVEMLSSRGEEGAFVDLPPLSCGEIFAAAAIAVEESVSAAGQVLLLGGVDDDDEGMSTVHLVDLATGACARQPDLLHSRANNQAAARLPDGRIICSGDMDGDTYSSTEVWGPPEQGAPDAPWTWSELPATSVARQACCGCVMSDGRFAVLGGHGGHGHYFSSCEALVLDGDAHWEPLPPMRESRSYFECAAVAGCVFVAGGYNRT
jgi:hypothetical protein